MAWLQAKVNSWTGWTSRARHRIAALVSAGTLSTSPILLYGIAIMPGEAGQARAQTSEAIARTALSITVRIEGSIQGSGALVRREGNGYTVLTALQVVEGQRYGEEMNVVTSDGQRHQVIRGSITRIGQADMAALIFMSRNNYSTAAIGNLKAMQVGGSIYVSGLSLPSETASASSFIFLRGDVVANRSSDEARSHYFLFRSPTLPGMIGGAILNSRGELIGIHVKAVRAEQVSESTGKPVAIGINRGIALDAFSQWAVNAMAVQATAPRSLSRVDPGQPLHRRP